jgi:mRNA interferase HigB
MRIIAKRRLNELVAKHARAMPAVRHWYLVASKANWGSLDDVRKDFGSADDVRVASGRRVLVFNIGGGNYRLIVGRNYDVRILFIKRLLTHGEYDKNQWKVRL